MPTVVEQQDRAYSGTFNNGHRDQIEIHESLSNSTKAALIEQMKLTEPMKVAAAPNHLLETKIYAKVGQNDLVHAKPSVIHFEGFEVDKKQVKSLKLLNASSDLLKMHIIPPQTQNFTIKYTKPTRMVPGMALECMIEFKPNEWRYFYDCIRIHCPGEENLIIPIHGYPVMNTKEFPRNYTFEPIPVGYRVSEMFPLKSMSPIDFEFNFKFIQSHPAFSIEPMSGIVPANSQVEVTVTFAPYEFQTSTMIVGLIISQFNLKTIVCTFTGSSQPGLLKEKTMLATEVLDPKDVSPLDRARTKKLQAMAVTHRQKTKNALSSSTQKVTLEKDGIRFPAILNSPHAVGKVLMQEPGKLRASEMRPSVLAKSIAPEESSQQMKVEPDEGFTFLKLHDEAMFEHAVRQNVYEERQNQLRWQVKVGDDPLSAQDRYRILEERSVALSHYKLKRKGVPVAEIESTRLKTSCTYRRTMRDADEVAPETATFDAYSNDLWAVRYAALERFVQAARTIIIRNRVDKRLPYLKTLVKDFHKTKNLEASEGDNHDRPERLKSVEYHSDTPVFTVDKIKHFRFPTYINPSIKDDMAPDALGVVPFTPTQIVIKKDVHFFNLKVPQYFKLEGYIKHPTSGGYMPVKQVNALRIGAEDEIIKVPDDVFSPCKVPERIVGNKNAVSAAMKTKVAIEKRELTPVSIQPQALSLKPPSALFRSIDYPSLQIMNPVPGLQSFLPPVPYSEVDNDYHLCPLPRYPRTDQVMNKYAVTQKRFLEREDTIKGIMSWKKFPSPGLVSLSNTPTLSSVWVPRWDDCFSKDILPEDVPPLLGRLDPDDAENCVDSQEDGAVCLNPEMVNAQFSLIDPNSQSDDQIVAGDKFPNGNSIPRNNIPVGVNGPVAKEQREVELDYFNTKKYNRLGTKFNEQNDELNAKVTDQDLILK